MPYPNDEHPALRIFSVDHGRWLDQYWGCPIDRAAEIHSLLYLSVEPCPSHELGDQAMARGSYADMEQRPPFLTQERAVQCHPFESRLWTWTERC